MSYISYPENGNAPIRLLAEKFGPVDPDTQATIQRFDENRLFESAKRCFTAQTLPEALGQ